MKTAGMPCEKVRLATGKVTALRPQSGRSPTITHSAIDSASRAGGTAPKSRSSACAAFEQCLEPGDPLVRPVGEVQERALLDLAGLAVALAQQDSRRRVAIGDRFDIHGNIIAMSPPYD